MPLVKPTMKGKKAKITVEFPGEIQEDLRLYGHFSGASIDDILLEAFMRLCAADSEFTPWKAENAANYPRKKVGRKPSKLAAAPAA
jgi:hypothetical protein